MHFRFFSVRDEEHRSCRESLLGSEEFGLARMTDGRVAEWALKKLSKEERNP